jgi:hypothetical protein
LSAFLGKLFPPSHTQDLGALRLPALDRHSAVSQRW